MSSIWLDMMGSGVQERFYDAGGVNTRVLEAGDPDDPLVILLHGTGGHAETYCRNIGPLSERFHVVAPDMMGHGYTDRPSVVDYTLDDFAGHVVCLIDALGVRRAHVTGESLGAMVSAWTAISRPGSVDKVVLNTGILARPDDAGQTQLDDLAQRTAKLADDGVTREAVRHRMEWLVGNPEDMTDEMVDVRLRIYEQDGMLDDVSKIMTKVIGMIRGDAEMPEDYFADGVLEKLKKPAMVLWTEDNPGQSLDLAKTATEAIDGARFEVMSDCAHWPQFEQPATFNELYLDFLSD